MLVSVGVDLVGCSGGKPGEKQMPRLAGAGRMQVKVSKVFTLPVLPEPVVDI